MSHTGQCYECAALALNENIAGISRHEGPAFQRWRRAMVASVGGVLLDDAQRGR